MTHALHRLPAAPPLQLWLVDLDRRATELAAAGTPTDDLDEPERARAARFVFDRDRMRWIAARQALRHLLGRHTGTPAGQLRFGEGTYGKPHLEGQPRCAFSLSHSDGFALVAIVDESPDSPGCAVGVDLEVARPMPDLAELAQRCFTRDECRLMNRTPLHRRERLFLSGWTRKEACLKALGYGLQIEPSSFSVGLPEPDERDAADAGPDGDSGAKTVVVQTPSGVQAVTVANLQLPDSLVGALAWVRMSASPFKLVSP
jgi:4'-phosphopantetheinyl transferase